MDIHELCQLFPEMGETEFKALCDDIKENGMIDPIITYKKKIVDGRHRYKAGTILGCDLRYEEWHGQGGSLLAFVVSRNLHRRSLTPSQRATIAVDVKDRLNGEYKERSLANLGWGGKNPHRVPNIGNSAANAEREAAGMMDVSHGYVSDASRVRAASPELFEEVKQGKKTIPQAKRELSIGKPPKQDRLKTSNKEAKLADNTGAIERLIARQAEDKMQCEQLGFTEVVQRIESTIKALKLAAL